MNEVTQILDRVHQGDPKAAEELLPLVYEKLRKLAAPEELHESRLKIHVPADELLAVHEALDGLASVDATAAELVKLRYFVGMTLPEAAKAWACRCARRNDSGRSAGPGCGTRSGGPGERILKKLAG